MSATPHSLVSTPFFNAIASAAARAAKLEEAAAVAAAKVEGNIYSDGSNPASWTNGKPGDGSLNLATHWEKHKAEFPSFISQNDYYRAAQDFVSKPTPGTLVKATPNGDLLLYEPKTNTFAVKSKDGLPRTMFKPSPAEHGFATNMDFWNSK